MQQHTLPPGYNSQHLRTLTCAGVIALMIAAFAPAAAAAEEEPEETGASKGAGEVETTQPDMEDAELLLVMDASGSMSADDAGGQTRIAAAKDSLTNLLDTMDEDEAVGLRIFSGEVTESGHPDACEDSNLAVDIGTDNRDELAGAIDNYDAVGAMTPLAHALEEAAEDFDGEGPRTIVLVSDGMENCNPDPCEAAQALMDQGIDLQIHTVGFSLDGSEAEEAREQLSCIADAGNGEFFNAEDEETLTTTLHRLSTRAFQPFTLHGEEVDGAAEITDAPTLEPGQYTDQWETGAQYYRIPRSVEGSTLHVGVTSPHSEEASADPLTIALGTEDTENWATYQGNTYSTNRDLCAQKNMYEGSSNAAINVRSQQVTAYGQDEDSAQDCVEADELILQLEAVSPSGDTHDYEGEDFEFVVVEEPPVANRDELPERFSGSISDYTWDELEVDQEDAEEVLGGNSFNSAPVLEPGKTYSSDMLPGESMVYRVPVEWGQHLQAQLETPSREEFDPEGSTDRGFHLQLYGPHRGQIDHSTTAAGQEETSYGQSHHDQPSTWQNMTHPVAWANREASGGHSDMEFASVAGEYYVMISQFERTLGDDYLVPFTLTVDTFGEPEGEPEYLEEDEPTPPEEDEPVTPEAADQTPAATETPAPAEGSDDDQPVAAEQTGFLRNNTGLAIGLGALALLLLITGGFVLSRSLRKKH